MDKSKIVKKVTDKLAQTNTDAKTIAERIDPLVKEYKNKRSNRKEVALLINNLLEQFPVDDSSEELRRGILFTFRDNDFFHPAETQDLWHDLAETWGVTKYFPHLINKTKLTSS